MTTRIAVGAQHSARVCVSTMLRRSAKRPYAIARRCRKHAGACGRESARWWGCGPGVGAAFRRRSKDADEEVDGMKVVNVSPHLLMEQLACETKCWTRHVRGFTSKNDAIKMIAGQGFHK